ncbi:MAG TPA: hypothetical protein VF940_03335 [Streptosporangiaceae bacterium]
MTSVHGCRPVAVANLPSPPVAISDVLGWPATVPGVARWPAGVAGVGGRPAGVPGIAGRAVDIPPVTGRRAVAVLRIAAAPDLARLAGVRIVRRTCLAPLAARIVGVPRIPQRPGPFVRCHSALA